MLSCSGCRVLPRHLQAAMRPTSRPQQRLEAYGRRPDAAVQPCSACGRASGDDARQPLGLRFGVAFLAPRRCPPGGIRPQSANLTGRSGTGPHALPCTWALQAQGMTRVDLPPMTVESTSRARPGRRRWPASRQPPSARRVPAHRSERTHETLRARASDRRRLVELRYVGTDGRRRTPFLRGSLVMAWATICQHVNSVVPVTEAPAAWLHHIEGGDCGFG